MAKIEFEARPRFSPRPMTFNSEVDLQEVDQFGFLDLREAFTKGIIPSEVSLNDENFNGVGVASCLIPHATDVFDSYRKAEYVRSRLDNLNASERERAQNAVERSTEAAEGVTS